MPRATTRSGAAMGGGAGSLTPAIAHLEERERLLLADLDTTRALMTQLRSLPPWPGMPANVQRERRAVAPDRRRKARGGRRSADKTKRVSVSTSDGFERAVRDALDDGPLSPGVLQSALGLSRYELNKQLAPLLSRGVVSVTGVTTGRRIALPGKPAKEAP